MITNVQISTTQLTVSQYKISFFPYLSTHCYTKHIYQMANRNWCIPFYKHCDFLEGIACLRHGMTFSSAAADFAEHLRSIASKFGVVEILTVMR